MAPAGKRRKRLSLRKKAFERAESKLGGEDTATADLEAIVFGAKLKLSDDKDGHDEAELSEDADDMEEASLPFSQEAARPSKKRRKKRRRKAGDASDEDEKASDEAAAAAWHDPDDATLEVDLTSQNRTKKLRRFDAEAKISAADYEQRLRDQFVKLHGSVEWAAKKEDEDVDPLASSDSEDGELDLVATSARPTSDGASGVLRPGKIDIKTLQRVEIPALADEKQASDKVVSQKAAVVQSLQFHPDSELMLTAGLDKSLRFFNVDGSENGKVASYFFKDFPIRGARFSPDGSEVLLTGKREKMWSLDVKTGQARHFIHHTSIKHDLFHHLVCGPSPSECPSLRANQLYTVMGDQGTLLVCDIASKQPVRELRMSMQGVASVFSKDRDVLYSADRDSNIYEWDLATGRCKQRMKAAWATGIETLALRPVTARAATPLLAVGTASGNIDLYDLSQPSFSKEPIQSISNLTTMVTTLAFHPEGEVMVGASKFKKEALRLMHTATGTVFQNWPTLKTPLNRITSVDFSRQGGLMAASNERGKVLLYQLRHYAKSA